MVSAGIVPADWLDAERLAQAARPAELRSPAEKLAQRLNLAKPGIPPEAGPGLYFWIARSLGLGHSCSRWLRMPGGAWALGGARVASAAALRVSARQ